MTPFSSAPMPVPVPSPVPVLLSLLRAVAAQGVAGFGRVGAGLGGVFFVLGVGGWRWGRRAGRQNFLPERMEEAVSQMMRASSQRLRRDR